MRVTSQILLVSLTLTSIFLSSIVCKSSGSENEEGAVDYPSDWTIIGCEPSHRGGMDSGELPMGKLLWKTKIGMTGILRGVEFALVDGKIYVVSLGETIAEWDRFMENPPKDELEGVYCLSAETGEIIWHADIGEDPFSSVLVQDNRCYLYSADGPLCLSARSGEKIWFVETDEHPVEHTLALYDDKLITSDYRQVVALNSEQGEFLWETELAGRVCNLISIDENIIAGCEGEDEEIPGYLFCISSDDGEIIWKYPASDFQCPYLPTSYHDKKLYYHSGDGCVHCVDFETGEADWVYEAREWEESDNYAEGGYFVLNPLSGYPCVVDDKFYIGRSQDPGYIYCVSLDVGELLWKRKVRPNWIDDWVDTTPAYADGRLYFGWGGKDPEWDDQSNAKWYLSCISADDGTPLWDFEVEDRVATVPFVIDGRVYFGGSNGYFYCLE